MPKFTIVFEMTEDGFFSPNSIEMCVNDTRVPCIKHLLLEVDVDKQSGRLNYSQSRAEGIWDIHSYGDKADSYSQDTDKSRRLLTLDESEEDKP
jgi:hypothetical protein